MKTTPSAFRRLARPERVQRLLDEGLLTADEATELLADVPVLGLDRAEQMIENVIGVYGLPLAIVPNVRINGRDWDVPMVTEEPSVVAAQANAARLARVGGGYTAEADEPLMIAQIQVVECPDPETAVAALMAAEDEIRAVADAAIAGIVRRGGGTRGMRVRTLRHPDDPQVMLVVHLEIDTRDAMGANAVNTVAEACAPRIGALSGGRVVLRILSNLSDLRRARASVRIPFSALTVRDQPGAEVAEGIVRASQLAEIDPWRAATHNKGIMNGIDALVLATGNDFRAVEAGAHAWAARDGHYTALSIWRIEAEHLLGRIELPMALGIVGGQTRTHPWVPRLLRILGVESAAELAGIAAAVGLGQNFTALRALASVGIQAGHMAMHARAVALDAGARPEDVPGIAARMRELGKIDRATAERLIRDREAARD